VLEDLNRLKEEFIATASHDLKGPLTSIRGYTQLLLRHTRGAGPDRERVMKGLAVIEAQTEAMNRLLDRLLDASCIQAGVLDVRTQPCELGECLDTVLARLSPPERGRVDVALPDAPLAGEWDQTRVASSAAGSWAARWRWSWARPAPARRCSPSRSPSTTPPWGRPRCT
jgi:signal transduction histidine kinase